MTRNMPTELVLVLAAAGTLSLGLGCKKAGADAPPKPGTEQSQATQTAPMGSGAGEQPGTKAGQGSPSEQGSPSKQAPTAQQGSKTEQAQQVMAHADAAISAIRRDDRSTANQLLGTMATTLRGLYEDVPGRKVLGQMGQAAQPAAGPSGAAGGGGAEQAAPGYVPLMAEIQTQSVYLDPQVVAKVEQAQKQAEGGDAQAAQQSLRLARDQMVADIALLPVEDAYSRVLAARAELEAGRKQNALQLLQNLPVVLAEVQVSAPLVPVRFNLRAAAAAAEAKNWERAQALLSQAETQLDSVVSSGQGAKELRPIADKAEKIRTRMESGNKPKPREIRALAEDIQKRVRTM